MSEPKAIWLADNTEKRRVYWVKYQLMFRWQDHHGNNMDIATGLLTPNPMGGYRFEYMHGQGSTIEHIKVDILREAKRMAKVLYELGVRS